MTETPRRGRRTMVAAGVAVAAAIAGSVFWGFHTASVGDADQLAMEIDLRDGMTVGEIGAGKGLWTVRIARLVGVSGRVYSNELDLDRLEDIRRAVGDSGLTNVTIVEGGPAQTNFPESCCDVIFMRHVYHHIQEPAAFDADLLRRLRPGGTLAVIDFEATGWMRLLTWFAGRPGGVPDDRRGHGMPLEVLERELTSAGFEQVRAERRWSGRSYLAVFRRPF